MKVPDYDALLMFRCRHRLTCAQLGKILDIQTGEIEAIEADAAVIQPENFRRFREVMGMKDDQAKELIRTIAPGAFNMPRLRREALRWRWRNSLTREMAAEKLRMDPNDYRLAESDAPGTLLAKIRKLERQARSSKVGK